MEFAERSEANIPLGVNRGQKLENKNLFNFSQRIFFICLLVFVFGVGFGAKTNAATYYVSTSGADTNNGTSPATPWAHHPWDANATNTAQSTVLHGDDIVNMKKGEVWWDCSFTANDNGSNGHQILTTSSDSFGSGSLPVCTGSYNTTAWDAGWTDIGGDIYSRTSIDTHPVVAIYNGSYLSENTSTPASPSLNQFGWSSNILYINIGENPSSTSKWRVGKRNYPFLIQADYITSSNIQFDTANTTVGGVIYIDTQIGIVLDSLNLKYSGLHGLYIDSSALNDSATLLNSTISDIKVGASCVRIRGGGSSSSLTIRNNILTGGTYGISDTTAGITTTNFYQNTISGQTINVTSAAGINISFETSSNIYSNTIYNIGDSNNSDVYGIKVSTNSNNIYDNIIHDVRNIGIVLNGNSNNVYGNSIYNCGYMSGSYPYTYPTSVLKYGAGSSGGGIHVGTNASSNNVYRNNVYDSTQGISLNTSGGTGGNNIHHNLAYNYIVNGIGDYQDANPTNRNLFYNNTVYHSPSIDNSPAYTGHGFYLQDVSSGGGKATFSNNICYNAVASSSSHSFFISDNGNINSVYLNNNEWYSVPGGSNSRVFGTSYTDLNTYKIGIQGNVKATGLDGIQANAESQSLFSDPLLTSSSNFHLQSTSPAINAGDNSIWSGTNNVTDFEGNAITNGAGTIVASGDTVDIGAYEFQDTFAPVNGSFTINNDDANTNSTSATLNITCPTDTWAPIEMAYGNSANPTNWKACATSQAWTLASGDGTKTVYMRFRDGGENTTSDTTDTIILDSTPPVRSLGSPSGEQAAGISQITISLTTNESATCKYSTAADTAYASMTGAFTNAGGTAHSTASITGLADGISYTYYIRCADDLDNANTTDYEIAFSIAEDTAEEDDDDDTNSDHDSLQITNVEASSTSNSITIEWETNNKSDSKVFYGTNKDLGKEKEETTNEEEHKITLNNLDSDTIYYYKVKSKDREDDEDVSEIHSIRTEKAEQSDSSVETQNLASLPSGENESENNKNNNSANPAEELKNQIQEQAQTTKQSIDNFFTSAVKKIKDKFILSEIKLRIIDKNNNPIPNLLATIHSEPQTSTTNQEGIITFKNIEAGKHTIAFAYQNETYEKRISIEEPKDGINTIQAQITDIKAEHEKLPTYIIVIIAVLVMIILWLVWSKRRRSVA